MAGSAIASGLEDWLLDQALVTNDLVAVVDGLCRRVHGAGIPINRVVLAWPTLHPLFDAETVVWTRDGGSYLRQFPHTNQESEDWLLSPMRHMLVRRLDFFRRRLTGDEALLDFPMLAELAAEGITDYVGSAIRFEIPRVLDEDEPERGGIITTWTTDRPDGFSDGDIRLLGRLNRGLATVSRTALLSRIATNIAETYLGRRAGGEVLAGLIRRGDGQTIRAVIWYSDLRGSTALANRLPPDDFLALLNRYFEYTAGAVAGAGGEILDFIGDAVLAIFPIGDGGERAAVAAATAAADEALARLPGTPATGEEPLEFGVALAVGDVMFGNIGIPARLTFSVIGRTVNAVARIEKATKAIGVPVLATADVADADPAGWQSVGEHSLDGVSEPVALFTRLRP